MVEMIHRAGNAPLTVTLDLTRWGDAASASKMGLLRWILETHAEQIGTLIIPAIDYAVIAAFAAKASSLRTLMFVLPGQTADNIYLSEPSAAPPVEFSALKSLETPYIAQHACFYALTLKTLVLYEPPLTRNQLRLQQELLDDTDSVMDMLNDDDYALDVLDGADSVMDMLGAVLYHAPQLGELDIHLPSNFTEVSDDDGGVELPAARKLSIIGATSACARFLSLVQVPQAAKVSMDCFPDVHFSSSQDLPNILYNAVMDPRKFATTSFPPLVSASIAYRPVAMWGSPETEWEIRGWRSLRPLRSVREDDEPDVLLRISYGSFPEHVYAVLATAPFYDVRALRFGPWQRPEHDPYKNDKRMKYAVAICKLPQLEHLTLEGCTRRMASEIAKSTLAQSVLMIDCDEEGMYGSCIYYLWS